MNIRGKIITGLGWTYAERTLAQIISLLVTIVLARILDPSAYGVVSIVTIFIGFADTFAINGLGNALVQKKNSDQLDFSTVFYFNIGFSMVIYLLIFCISPFVGMFYDSNLLVPVLRIMALRIPVAAINSVQQAYVSRNMDFKRFFLATLGGTLVSAVFGIVLAYLGFGVWALAVQYLSNTLIDTIVLWFTVRWRPTLEYSWKRLKGLFSYGWKVLASSLLITIYGDIQNLIIGKKFSTTDLAYSEKGRQFPSVVATNINASISKVLFPAMAECQEDISAVKALMRRAISAGTYLLSPILFGMAASADNLVSVVLTDKWTPCVPYFRIMCLVFLLQPIQTASIQAIKAIGRSDVYLKLEIIKKTAGILVLLYTVLFCHSVFSIIVGSLIAEIISSVLNFPANRSLFGYMYTEQIADVGFTLGLNIIMALAVYFIGNMIHNPLIALLLQIPSGVLIYILLSIVTKNRNYIYIYEIMKDFSGRRKVK